MSTLQVLRSFLPKTRCTCSESNAQPEVVVVGKLVDFCFDCTDSNQKPEGKQVPPSLSSRKESKHSDRAARRRRRRFDILALDSLALIDALALPMLMLAYRSLSLYLSKLSLACLRKSQADLSNWIASEPASKRASERTRAQATRCALD